MQKSSDCADDDAVDRPSSSLYQERQHINNIFENDSGR